MSGGIYPDQIGTAPFSRNVVQRGLAAATKWLLAGEVTPHPARAGW